MEMKSPPNLSFSILDASKNRAQKSTEEENEDWLNEEIDDSLQQKMVETKKGHY